MSWDRPTLKAFAKEELRLSYWIAFCVCLVGGLIGGYASGNNAGFSTTVNTNSDQIGYYIERSGFFRMESLVLIPIAVMIIAVALAYGAFVAGPLRVGMARFFTQCPKGDRQFSNLFWGFSGGYYKYIVKTMFVTDMLIFVGYLLFIIPGIIFHYKYCMVPYILAQEPHLDTHAVMELSDHMTQGDKFNIFVLDLSFFGWYLLGGLFFGVGVLFVNPYVEATYAQLYGALNFKVKGTDPYDSARRSGGYPPPGGGQSGPDAYQWGADRQPGGYTPPGQGYTPPPPPPYGSHRYGPDEKQPPEQAPWDKKGQ